MAVLIWLWKQIILQDYPEVEQSLNQIQLTLESRQEVFEIVENLFAVSTKQMDELLVYAKTHCFDQPFTEPREILQP